MAVVANVPLYAGAVQIAPGARVDDGLLDILAFDGAGLPDTLRHLAGLTAGRSGADGGDLARARKVTLVTAQPMPVHLDAEPHGHTPLRVSVAPGALQLLVPSGAPGGLFARREAEA
jgi:diacylglycerol kinase family enzyme